jgi:hypothetical protein
MSFAAQVRRQKTVVKPIVVDNEKVHGMRALQVTLISAVAVPSETTHKAPRRGPSPGATGDANV